MPRYTKTEVLELVTEALVTVGGMGSRLRGGGFPIPCTKSFIDVLGEPLIYWNLRVLERAKFSKIVICADDNEAIRRARAQVDRFNDVDIEFSFVIDTGLGTAGLPVHFMHLFDSSFYFITGHSFVSPCHLLSMRSVAVPGNVVVSTFDEQIVAKNIRTSSIHGANPDQMMLPIPSRMIDYPYILDGSYCKILKLNKFDVIKTLRYFARLNAVKYIHSELPVETDEPEQFDENMNAISSAIIGLSLR